MKERNNCMKSGERANDGTGWSALSTITRVGQQAFQHR